MIKLKKVQIIFGIIILLVIAFIGGIEIKHYQQNKRANDMQIAIDQRINSHITENRVNVTVPNPKHINISLKGGEAEELGDILSAGKQLKKFNFWQYLKAHVNETDDNVQKNLVKELLLV